METENRHTLISNFKLKYLQKENFLNLKVVAINAVHFDGTVPPYVNLLAGD